MHLLRYLSIVEDSEPDRGLVRRRPLDAVTTARRNVDEIPRPHIDAPVLIFEAQSGRSLQYQHPLGLLLVVPESGWRDVAM